MANQTRQLAELLRGEGAQVELVQTNSEYRPAWIGKLPGIRAAFRLLPFMWALWSAAGRNHVFHVMANSGWSWHLFAAPAIWLAHLRGRPVLVNYRGGEAEGFLQRQGRVIGFSLRRADTVLVPSGFLEQVFAKFGHKALVLPNIVNLDRFKPTQGRAARVTPRLLVARNLEALYDNASAIRALALVHQRFPDAVLTIAGTGPEAASLRALTHSLGLEPNVHFVGRLDPEGMAAAYRASTVSINPSLADNMPNSVLESLASGVPVVSTNVGGVPFLVQDEQQALLVKPQDPAGMAAAILRLLEDPILYDRLRKAGLAHVQQFTWARIGPSLARHYLQLIGESRATARSPRI